MKKIFSFVFAAMMLLVSSSAMAQSETLKGDVNADGVVDVADIAAIIKIMQETGGAVEATKYYWYAGWTIPTAENIATIVNETYPSAKGSTTMNPAGKTSTTLAGTVIDFCTNPIYDQEARNAGTPREFYFVIPTGYGIYNPNMKMYLQDGPSFEKVGEFTNHRILKNTEGASYKIAGGWIICELTKYN